MTTRKATPPETEGVPVELQLKPLIDEAKELQEAIKPLEERLEEIKDDVRVLTGGKYQGEKVTVSPNRRLDTEAIAARYPVKEFPYLYALVISTDAVKAKLPPETLDTFYKNVGKDRVTFK